MADNIAKVSKKIIALIIIMYLLGIAFGISNVVGLDIQVLNQLSIVQVCSCALCPLYATLRGWLSPEWIIATIGGGIYGTLNARFVVAVVKHFDMKQKE